MKQSSHSLDSVGIRFDAVGLVTNAGLILPATPGDRPGVRGLIDEHVHLGKVTGAANPGQKAMTVVASLLAGGDHIDDVNALRSGGTAAVLGLHWSRRLPSTPRTSQASSPALPTSSAVLQRPT